MTTRVSVILLVLVTSVHSAKILLLTTPAYSQCGEISGVGRALADRGHDVYILIGSTFDHKECFNKGYNGTQRIQPIIFQDSPNVRPIKEIITDMTDKIRVGKEFSVLSEIKIAEDFSRNLCTNLFYDKLGFEKLKREKFDLVITLTMFFSYCHFVIPYKLNIPYVGVSTFFEDFISGRPFLPSIVNSPVTRFTDSMTFFERLANAASSFGLKYMSMYVQTMDVLKDVAPELSRQDLLNLASKCELYLYNYDVTLSYPVPVMPNHVLIGGIAAGPATPLPVQLDQFYEKSAKGVVLVTFGSNLGKLEKRIEDNLRSALKRLDVNVLWKGDFEDDFDNIKQVKWLPQNDLLGNPKTKVFVSHCGNNGVFEALYHGVPLVCTPVFGDQFYNGIRVQHWKAGKTLPLATSSKDEFYDAINAVLTDPIYRKNMKKASEMYHSQPMTARERAAFWVEYILKFGGGHLRSRASEMSTFAYMGYDLVCFVIGVLVIFLVVTVKSLKALLRCCIRRREKLKTN